VASKAEDSGPAVIGEGMESALRRILAVEEEARTLLEAAKTEGREIVATADAEAEAMRRNTRVDAERKADEMLTTERLEAARERESILRAAEHERALFVQKASPRIDEAIAHVVEAIAGAAGVENVQRRAERVLRS